MRLGSPPCPPPSPERTSKGPRRKEAEPHEKQMRNSDHSARGPRDGLGRSGEGGGGRSGEISQLAPPPPLPSGEACETPERPSHAPKRKESESNAKAKKTKDIKAPQVCREERLANPLTRRGPQTNNADTSNKKHRGQGTAGVSGGEARNSIHQTYPR